MATCLACLVGLWGHFMICVCTLAAQAKLKQNGCSSHEGWSGSDRVEIEVPHQTINSTTYKSNYTTRLTTTMGNLGTSHTVGCTWSSAEVRASQTKLHSTSNCFKIIVAQCLMIVWSTTRTTQQQNNTFNNLQQLTRAAHNSIHQRGSTKRMRTGRY